MAVKAGSGLLPGNITAGENSFVFAESQAFTLSYHKSILSLLLRPLLFSSLLFGSDELLVCRFS